MLAKIWEQAMIKKGDNVVDRYINLFRNHPQCLDIQSADTMVSKSAAQVIWTRLRTSYPDAFFFPNKIGTDRREMGAVCLS